MPRAYGRDRVELLDRGRVRIVSPTPKGWRAAKPATRTTAEFPGTAVAWDDAIWEVVSSEERTGTNCRYVLAPWKENHAIRLTADYNAHSEAALAEARRKSAARNSMSAGIYAMGLFAGHLPAHIQKQIESEYGFVATRLTLLSFVPEMILAGISAMGLPIEELHGPKWPAWVLVLGLFAVVDVVIRSWYCLTNGRPLGSVPGLMFWYLAMLLSPGARRFDREGTRRDDSGRGTTSSRAPSDSEREHDVYALREPFLALLPAGDQQHLATTFGFDPIAWGRRSVLTIAVVAGSGVLSSLIKIGEGTAGGGTLLSLILAGLLFAEQLLRLRELMRGNPAGSVLGAIFRPYCAVLLTMQPRGLEKGTTRPAARALPEVWEGVEPGGNGEDDQTGR